jgi:hypothetical protein
MQIEIHTAKPLIPDPSPFDIDIATAKLKRYKLPGSAQIPAELIHAGGAMLVCAILVLLFASGTQFLL